MYYIRIFVDINNIGIIYLKSYVLDSFGSNKILFIIQEIHNATSSNLK